MPQSGSSSQNFDLNSQSGVMSVLASIRASALGSQEKNELRDLVFHYTKNGGDPSVRISLEQKLISHQIVPVQVKVNAGPLTRNTLAFGSYRPVPTFKAPPLPATPPQAPIPIVVPTPVVTPPVSPQPVSQVTPTPASVVFNQPTTPASQTPVIVATLSSETEYLERIRQIKTAVNSKVGNPVNLVDINNEVGREYMNALLEAMKKLSSGAISEMGVAMNRLETAFKAVEVAIAEHAVNVTNAASEAVPNNVPVPPPPQINPVADRIPSTTQMVSGASIATVSPAASEPVDAQVSEPSVYTRPDLAASQPPIPAEVIVEPSPEVVARPEDLFPNTSSEPEAKSGYEIAESTPEPTSPSLADKDKIHTIADLPDAATLSTGTAGDNLFTKEIDDGLTLLLSDWVIFKKSGLFGTGPKGREHPLFKKIAELQIPLILAGRFEGSSQEIRQSITDYMNGWRYEQGIIYQPGESFEHYLRRVIRHIIDLQNKHR